MRRIIATTVFASLALAATTALAGSYGKCTHTTQECLNLMAEKVKSKAWVGVELETERAEGYLVTKVIDASPAQAAGIQAGDVLYAMNGVVISKANDEKLKAARGEWKVGQTVKYTVQKDGAEREANVTLAPVPADVMARWIGEHMLEHAQLDVAKGTDGAKK